MHESLCRPSHYAGYVAAKQKAKHILQSVHPHRALLMAASASAWRQRKLRQTELSVSYNERGEKKKKFMKSQRTNERKQCRPVWHKDNSAAARHNFQCNFSCHASHFRRVIFWCLLPGSAPTSPFVSDAVSVAYSVLEAPREPGRDHHLWMILIYLFCSTSQCVHKCPNEAN